MTVLTESKYLGDVLKYEAEDLYCREAVTVLAGSGAARELTVGMVLGRITKGAAVGAADAGNRTGGQQAVAPVDGVTPGPHTQGGITYIEVGKDKGIQQFAAGVVQVLGLVVVVSHIGAGRAPGKVAITGVIVFIILVLGVIPA